MNNARLTYKYSTTVVDNYGIISSYSCNYRNAEDSLQLYPKTTLFKTSSERGKETKREKED